MSVPSKPWVIALGISLVLNVFLGGMLVGRWMSSPKRGHHGPGRLSLKGLRGQLDPAAHGALDKVEAKYSKQIRTRMHEARQCRRRAMDAVTAEPFDEQAARVELAEFRNKWAAAHQTVHDALVELAASLPPERRAQLREAMKRRHKRFGRHSSHHRPRPGAVPTGTGGIEKSAEPPTVDSWDAPSTPTASATGR